MNKTDGELIDLEEAALNESVLSWELAGLRRAFGWAPGKLVTGDQFKLAVNRFRTRRQGDGELSERRING